MSVQNRNRFECLYYEEEKEEKEKEGEEGRVTTLKRLIQSSTYISRPLTNFDSSQYLTLLL
jgi:hypothetical protein